MAKTFFLIRFFRVVPPVPRLMVATFVMMTMVVGVVIVLEPAQATGALMPVLVLQLFAASSGFSVPARRGYYDLLITRGESRLRIALVHWAMSIAPGVASCLGIAAVELAMGRGRAAAALTSGTGAALVLVSTLPWAITVALPRFAGGIGWLLVVMLARIVPGGGGGEWFWAAIDRRPSVASVVGVFVYPGSLVGRHLQAEQVIVAAPALAVAACAMVAACLWIQRAAFPLEAAQ